MSVTEIEYEIKQKKAGMNRIRRDNGWLINSDK